MWVLWDTESLQCINISEWFLFHAYISDVTLIFATDHYNACTSMWTWAWAIRVQIYISNKIRSVKIIWSLGNEQKHSHDFSIHMQWYRVFFKIKKRYFSRSCRNIIVMSSIINDLCTIVRFTHKSVSPFNAIKIQNALSAKSWQNVLHVINFWTPS